MHSRVRNYLHRTAKSGVTYSYNNKFNDSNMASSVVGSRKGTEARGRILSNRDVNCMDAPSTTRERAAKAAIAFEGQENQPTLQNQMPAKLNGRKRGMAPNESNNRKKTEKRPFVDNTEALEKINLQVAEQSVSKDNPSATNNIKFPNKNETVIDLFDHPVQKSNSIRNADNDLASTAYSLHNQALGSVHCDGFENPVSDSILYLENYLQDIISHLLNHENEEVVDPLGEPILINYENCFLKVLHKFKDKFDLGIGEALTAIKIYQKVYMIFEHFEHLEVSAAIIWVANKICSKSVDQITLTDILDLWPSYGWKKSNLLSAERHILHKINFKIFHSDPLTFVAYYLIELRQPCSQQEIWNCTRYVLDCGLKSKDVLIAPISKLAAAALLNSLHYLRLSVCWEKLSQSLGYHPKETLKELCTILKEVFVLSDPNLKAKYQLPQNGCIDQVLRKICEINP